MSEYVRMTLPAYWLSESDAGADLLAVNGTPVTSPVTVVSPVPGVRLGDTVTIGWYAGE
jgi:hypothetical protein